MEILYSLHTALHMNAYRDYSACNYQVFGIKLLFSLEERGMFTRTPKGAISSSMSKPRSAIMLSPTSNSLSRPLRLTISLSDMEPGKRSETKVTTPDGDIPTKPLYVLVLVTQEC